VSYSPTNKFFIKRKTKKRKLDVVAVTTPDNEPMDIIWRYSSMDPYENLTRLLQFTRAYAMTTIDKATKVKMLLKEKEQKILFLEE